MKTKLYKFGFEIEGEFGGKARTAVRDFGSLKGDGSVRECTSSSEICGRRWGTAELVPSPFAITDIRSAKKIFEALAKSGEYHWNKTAGFHVHVSFKPNFPPEIFSMDFNNFFIKRMRSEFKTEYDSRKNNRYCQTLTRTEGKSIFNGHDRYKAINFLPAFEKHGTVEIRIFPSADPMKMYDYLLFVLKTFKDYLKQDSFGFTMDSYIEIAESLTVEIEHTSLLTPARSSMELSTEGRGYGVTTRELASETTRPQTKLTEY